MKRWPRVVDLSVTLFVIPLIVGVLPVLVPAATLPFILAALLTTVGPYLVWRFLAYFPERRLGRLRGVVSVASDRSARQGQFSEPWLAAKKEILVWGVGMTNLARDEVIITKGLERNLSATLEIVDAAWLRQRPDIAALVDATYGRPRFVEQIEDSTQQLIVMAKKLNKRFGDDRIQVWAVEQFVPQSATVADPGTNGAWGWVEWHSFGFPHGQVRFKLQTYRHKSELDPPLIEHVIAARSNLPRRRIDKGGKKPARNAEDRGSSSDN